MPFRYRIFAFATESGPAGDEISVPKCNFGSEISSQRLRRNFDLSKIRWKSFRPPGSPLGIEMVSGDEVSVPKRLLGIEISMKNR